MTFEAQSSMVTSTINYDGYSDSGTMVLGSVLLYGVNTKPQSVMMNSKAVQFTYDDTNKVSVED